MSKHLTKGCPLTVDMIAKQRRKFEYEANILFSHIPFQERRKIVTERVILLMDKFRGQTVLDFPIDIGVEEK